MIFEVLLLLSVLICFSLGNIATVPANETLQPYKFDEILKGVFKDKGWNGTWISDDIFVVKDLEQNFYKVDVRKNQATIFISVNVTKDFPRCSITITNDFKYVLIKYNTTAIFRYSRAAQFTIYDIENNKFYHLHNKKHLQLAKWAPVGTGLAYILENDIYYVRSIQDILKPRRLTKTGERGIIFNGIPDWVYEEEVLGSGSALWFSPDGKRLAFATFNDEYVLDYHYFIYGNPGDIEHQYPAIVSLKYPKVGTTNPSVKLKCVNLDNSSSEVIELDGIIPIEVVSPDYILQDVTWANDTDVVAVSLNRVQNIGAVFRCNVVTEVCYELYTAKQVKGWLDIKAPVFIQQGTKYLILSSEPETTDFFKHLSLVDISDVQLRKRLTFGKRTVMAIYGYDEKRNLIYYVGTVSEKSYQQQVYVYDLKTNIDQCLTCDFETPEGICEVASASFSKMFSHFAKICSGPGPKLVQVQNLETREYFVWEDNGKVRKNLLRKLRPIVKNLKVPLSNGLYATVLLLLPPQLNETSDVKYPLIVNVYAGPNSNRAVNAYSGGIENYFVTKRNYIYAYIDARGSGKNGNKLLFQMYRKFGTVEVEDQIEVTKYLQNHYQYIDANSTAIWGWSYGGFATLMALIKDTENVFKVGVAVAPVTNFIYYDSIYTERYMGLPTPEDNLIGYKDADIVNQVEGLRNKLFYIIHGNGDDNVHYQQSMLLSKALERADIMYFQQSYPDENHSLGHVHRHLYHTIDKFFDYGFRNQHKKTWKLRKSKKNSTQMKN